MLSVQVLDGMARCAPLREAWNRLVEGNTGGILGQDATVTYEWCMSLCRSHLDGSERQAVLVLRDDAELVGIMPCFVRSTSRLGIKIREITPLTQLYSVRSGFVVKLNNSEYLRYLLGALKEQVDGWDVFTFNVIDQSHNERAFLRASAALGAAVRRIHAHISPFIQLPPDPAEHLARLEKRFSADVKRRDRKLRAEQRVQVRMFSNPGEVDELTRVIMSIEKQSWKEDQGTSITAQETQRRFYEDITGPAAKNGWLRVFVLLADDEPLAYTYGLVFGGVFQNHKTSYVHAARSKGPGNVLRLVEISQLCQDGILLYDFMGECEPYKMRWGSGTYSVTTYALYNDTLRGRLENLRARWRRVRAPSTPDAAESLPEDTLLARTTMAD